MIQFQTPVLTKYTGLPFKYTAIDNNNNNPVLYTLTGLGSGMEFSYNNNKSTRRSKEMKAFMNSIPL